MNELIKVDKTFLKCLLLKPLFGFSLFDAEPCESYTHHGN